MTDRLHWMLVLDDHRSASIALALGASFALVLISCLYGPYGFDQWWHLRLGADWVEQGLSPWIDHRSYTFTGQTVINPPVLFELALYQFTQWFGEFGGANAFRALGYVALLLVTTLWLRQVRAPAFVYFVVLPLVVCAIQLRLVLRPEIISYTLAIVALMLYQRSRLQLSVRAMLPVALLLLAWNLYHTPIFGYIIFFGLFVDIAIRLFGEQAGLRSWGLWAAWGALLFVIGFANPDGSHFLISFLSFSGNWDAYIWEYRSAFYLRNRWAPYLILVATGITLLLAVRQKRIGYFLILIVFIYGAVNMARLVPPAGVIVAGMLGHLISESVVVRRPPILPQKFLHVVGLLILGLGAASWASGGLEARRLAENRELTQQDFPTSMTKYMRDSGRQGNIFHLFRLGGFLMYELAPDSAVYIDGRTNILYPIEHFQRYVEVLQNPTEFRKESQRLDIEFSVLPATGDYAERMWSAGFELDFSDIQYALFRRSGGAFPHLGRIWARPYCWDEAPNHELEPELALAARIFPEHAALLPLVSTMQDLASSDDPAGVVGLVDSESLRAPHFVRFLAYRALAFGRFDVALAQFGRLENLPPKDRMAVVMATFRAGDWENAHAQMRLVLEELPSWRNLEPVDLVILRALLDEMKQAGTLDWLDERVDRGLSSQLGDTALGPEDLPMDASRFCTASGDD